MRAQRAGLDRGDAAEMRLLVLPDAQLAHPDGDACGVRAAPTFPRGGEDELPGPSAAREVARVSGGPLARPAVRVETRAGAAQPQRLCNAVQPPRRQAAACAVRVARDDLPGDVDPAVGDDVREVRLDGVCLEKDAVRRA